MDMEKDYNLIVGLRIREIRESMHLLREKFSEKCDISTSFLADIERGKKALHLKPYIRFAWRAIYQQTIFYWDIRRGLIKMWGLKY